MKILYIVHYGRTEKTFYTDPVTGQPLKRIGDGGSNIHIHFIQYLLKKGYHITISTFKNNYQYEAFFGKITNACFSFFRVPVICTNLYKILILPINTILRKWHYDYIVSVTDFLPDTLYAYLIKMMNPRIKWIASYFLEAPFPFSKNNPYNINLKRLLTGIIYWLSQRLAFRLIVNKADFVLVTSDPDKHRFVTKQKKRPHVIVVQGGVDLKPVTKFLEQAKMIIPAKRKYDACFLGRLHYQKGCLELIDIWKNVCQQKPDAKLIIIGNGPLENDLRRKIMKYNLQNNIELKGFIDGERKYAIFRQSKTIVHPATYDSGGMSAAEAMAWGLPGVSFNLESLKKYYPKGMVKTPTGNNKKFADNIIKLLNNQKLYIKISHDAKMLIKEVWDWNIRSQYIYKKSFSHNY